MLVNPQDVRYSLRWLQKNLSFAIFATIIIGMGVGATTAVFTVVNAVLLQPLPYKAPDRIVVLSTLWKKLGPGGAHGPNPLVSVPDFHDWHDQSTSFEAMAYYTAIESALTVDSKPEFGNVASVTPEFFRVFGVEPVAGRVHQADEVGVGNSGAVLVSEAFAESHYSSAAGALGHSVRVANRVMPIIGVLPARFHFPGTTDVWFPANTLLPESTIRGGHNVQAVAKLKPQATLTRAQAELTAIGDRLENQYPASNTDKNVVVDSLQHSMVKDSRLMLYLLLGAAGLVLLVACGNIANLLLAKASTRRQEIALRIALGARRGRIVQQLLTESFILAAAAGAAGLFIASAGSRILISLAPQNVPRLSEAGIDLWALTFAVLVSCASCLAFGLAPALSTAKANVNEVLKKHGTRQLGAVHSRIGHVLVIGEIGISVVLVIGAILLIRSLDALQRVSLGFDTTNVLVMETSIPAGTTPDATRRAIGVYENLISDLGAIPGVSAIGAVRALPGSLISAGSYLIDRETFEVRPDAPQAINSVVAPGAFDALGIPLKAGRDFNARDTFDAPFTVVINEALARQTFPHQDPIGHMLVNGFDSPTPMKIVGIVGDIHQRGPAADPFPEIYMPYEQHPRASTSLRVIARTQIPPERMFEDFRRVASSMAPEMPVRFTTMDAQLFSLIASSKFRTLLLGIFAALALALAMAGIYAVISFAVTQRTGEIGLRAALGATPIHIVRSVFSEALVLTVIGLALGVGTALALSSVLSTLLFKVHATDAWTYGVAVILIPLVALLASYPPAARAARIDPAAALRRQ